MIRRSVTDEYFSQEQFTQERDSVWASSWVSVCRAEDVASHGAFVAASVAGEPIVVVRGKDDGLRAFANVCPHRGTTIMDGSGTAHALQCPYHLWTFRLDGTLATAPHMDRAPSFDKDDICLPTIAVESWNGWVFVNVDSAARPLGPQVRGLNNRLEEFDLGSLRSAGSIHDDQPWNWKITLENFSESYHHSAVHPQALQAEYPGQKSWVDNNGGEPWLWLDHVSESGSDPFAVCTLFPSHMFSVLRGVGMVWFRIEALGPTSTWLDIELFLPPALCSDDELVSGMLDSLRAINDEDTAINARTAAGLASRFASHGSLSHLEDGISQFRAWLANRQ